MSKPCDGNKTAKRVSWIAIAFAVPFLLLSTVCLANKRAVALNDDIREGMHDVLGRPDDPYNLIIATMVFFGTPGLLLLARSFFAPTIPQVFAILIGGCAFSMILVNLLFGNVAQGMRPFLAIAFIAFTFDLYKYFKARCPRI